VGSFIAVNAAIADKIKIKIKSGEASPMPTEITKNPKTPSVIGGAMIIAGTAVGAGMFSLPTVSSGMWFSWALLCLVFTWFCMFHSGLMILEANLNYPMGASFGTFVKDLLGGGWNITSGLLVAFVPVLMVRASRKRFGSPHYQVWGGNVSV